MSRLRRTSCLADRTSRHAGLDAACSCGGGDGDAVTDAAPPPPMPPADAAASPHRAPVVCVISGSGGCGKSTIVATMHTHRRCWACVPPCSTWTDVWKPLRLVRRRCSARYGGTYRDVGGGHAHRAGYRSRIDARRPGRTLWGPVAAPEQAELMARPVELLLDVLRRESDVVFIDTSVFWGDAMAAAVAASDRCLIVGDAAVSSATSASRVIELASRVVCRARA